MAQTQHQRRASLAVGAWLSHHERNAAWLVRQTEADPGTIGDFLNGNRWPKYATQGKIEKAIGWPAGKMSGIADGEDAPPLDGADGVPPVEEIEPGPLLAEATDEELAAEMLRRMTPHGGPTRGQRERAAGD